MQISVAECLSLSARRVPHAVALIFEGRSWTYQALDAQSSALAGRLEALGLKRHDRITLYGPNSVQWVVAYYAIMKMGGVVNPLNLMLTPREAAFAMKDCGARAIVGDSTKVAALQALPGETDVRHVIAWGLPQSADALDFDAMTQGLALSGANDAGSRSIQRAYPRADIALDDPCTVGYTSGTTGLPKGALLSHRAIVLNVEMTALMHVRTAADIMVSALPCSHVYGNVAMQSIFARGGTVVLHKTFNAAAVLASIAQYRATLLEGVPTMYMYLLNEPTLSQYDVSSLTRCTVGGQTMPVATMRAVEAAFGCPLLELWGMTELGGLGTTHGFYGPRKLGSIGIALPHVQLRIADLEQPERELPAGSTGELQVRGPITMREYVGQPEATAATLLAGGWLRTGDLARVDEDGFVFVVDRLKDLIITAGFNVYPAELERVIAEHPGVAMVAVGAIKDSLKGELAKAYVVAKAGVELNLDELHDHCRERLAAYKMPRAFQIVADLPKTSTGKVLRRELHTLDVH